MFRIGGWPIRNYRGLVWLAVAGPFDVFDVTSFYQKQAHARPPAKCFAWAVGPFETIEDWFSLHWRGHSMFSTSCLFIKDGPMRDRRRNVLHWRLAHSKPLTTSLVGSGGPIQCFRHAIFLSNAGPCKTIDGQFGGQRRARSMFSTSCLFIKGGPMRDRRRNVLHWRLAHSKPLTTSLACSGGPIQCFRHRTFLPNVGPMRD